MRAIVIKLMLFLGVMEGLSKVNLLVLLSGMGVAIAALACTELFFHSVLKD